jgi:hypothetical protein
MVDYRYSHVNDTLRYETTLERQIYKALHELERLQWIRHGTAASAPPSGAQSVSQDAADDSRPDCFYPLNKL